jgi:hypothetical protein
MSFPFQLNGDPGNHGCMADGPGREAGNWELATEDGAKTIAGASDQPARGADAGQNLDQTGQPKPPLSRRRHRPPGLRPLRHHRPWNYPEPSHEFQDLQIPLRYPFCPFPTCHFHSDVHRSTSDTPTATSPLPRFCPTTQPTTSTHIVWGCGRLRTKGSNPLLEQSGCERGIWGVVWSAVRRQGVAAG